jgi:hypothetical protein
MSEAKEAVAAPARKPHRKTENATQRMRRLEQELKEAREAAKREEREAFAIVGQAVLAEVEGDGELKARVQDILRRRVRGNTAKAAVAEWMV